MHNDANSTKKKRIILSTHRKSTAKRGPTKQQSEANTTNLHQEFKQQETEQSILNCASINNSLEIFQDDPKNRHLHFLQNEQERTKQSTYFSKERSMTEFNEWHQDSLMNKKSNVTQKQPKRCEFSKIETINLSAVIKTTERPQNKKLLTSPNKRYIDLTLKRNSKPLAHQSSLSFLPALKLQQPRKTAINRSIFQTERGILSSVSVNSLQFTTSSRATSEKKQALTITCHSYKNSCRASKPKELNQSNSIRLITKCI